MVIQVLDGRSIFHRMHMQYQCEQQLECFLAGIQGSAHLSKIIGA